MEKKNVYKVTIHNDDETVLYFIAKSKLDTACKYRDYVLEKYGEGKDGLISQYDDFDIEAECIAFE